MAASTWPYLVFGVGEPLVNFATGLFITFSGDLFGSLLFAGAASQIADNDVVLALIRMYASVLICFGICQMMVWQYLKNDPDLKQAHRWNLLMLIPDFHHLFFAYGLFFLGKYGRADASFIAHYAIQGTLTMGRIYFLLFESTGKQPAKRS